MYVQYPPPTSLLWPKMRGGLAIRTTPRTSEQAAANRKTQRSSSRKTERVMTKTGEEKRMVVESPRGSLSKVVKRKSLKSRLSKRGKCNLVKEVKMKRIRRPPVAATAIRRKIAVGWLCGKGFILFLAGWSWSEKGLEEICSHLVEQGFVPLFIRTKAITSCCRFDV